MRGRKSEIPEALLSGPFTVAEARKHGVEQHHLRDRRRFRRMFHDVYVSAELDDDFELMLKAATKLVPEDAVFSHHTAARLYQIPVPEDGRIHVVVMSSGTSRPKTRPLRVHRINSMPGFRELGGHRVTSPERLFVDLADELGLVDLVIAGDHMVRHGLATVAGLRTTAARVRKKNIRLARRAAGLVRERVDSPMETRLRLLLVLAGLPEPTVNVEVLLRNGGIRFTPDLHYPEARIAIEYDGDLHRTKVSKWRRDHTLRRQIPDYGWSVFAYNAHDVYADPHATIHEIHQALLRRGQPRTPSDTSDDVWKHFPRPDEDAELARQAEYGDEGSPDPWDVWPPMD